MPRMPKTFSVAATAFAICAGILSIPTPADAGPRSGRSFHVHHAPPLAGSSVA